MTKQEFISSLRKALSGLPQEDAERSVEFYDEMIDDRVEDGVKEEEAVAELGSVEDIAARILSDIPLASLVKAKVKPNRALKAWEIALLILGSPIWLPLLLSAAVVLLSVYIVIWSVIISLYAVDISFALCGIAGIAAAFIYKFVSLGSIAACLLYFGGGLVCAGLAVILFYGFNQAAKGILLLSRKMLSGIKSLFIGKAEA